MESLINQVIKGEKGAATKFYRMYAPRLRRFLVVKLPTEADAEDLLQEVFLSAFDSLPLFRGESSEMSWLVSIARHEIADFYRKRYVREIVEKTSPLFDSMVSELLSPEFVWKKKQIEKRFFAAYHSLSEQYQEVLSCRYELSMSVKETAEQMKLSLKATESLLFRARAAFRVAYESE